MKTTSLVIATLLTSICVSAQNSIEVEKYQLDNGLTVYLNQDLSANQVYGGIVVKAGSKNDPADATGMAHYLEHLLFKGTDELGTTNYALEKPHLDSIIMYYDSLALMTTEVERKRIQLLINQQSVKASKYGLPTEFDNLIKSIGGTGLNAYTTADMTVYHNEFPGEQMDKWLQLYSHRLMHPVFRSFQSELEVVYEEKNRSMDNFTRLLFEDMNAQLFKGHPYGEQTTLGHVEHLKNPSLRKMYAYFNTYYVANNMALVLCGNFNIDSVKPMIESHFSKIKSGEIPVYPDYPKTAFDQNITQKVKYTPIKLELMGYKTIPNNHKDKAALEVAVNLLFNDAETGRLNKLEREGKLMFAQGFDYSFNDDGAVVFLVVPKLIGQSFEKAEKLVLDQIDSLRLGYFTDDELLIIRTSLDRDLQKSMENYSSRMFALASLFGSNSSWNDYMEYTKRLRNVTKDEVIDVAQKYFGAHRFTLRSSRGTPKKTVLEKPGFKPVIPMSDTSSAFAEAFKKQNIAAKTPRYVNVNEDVVTIKLNESNKLYVTLNPVNQVFDLTIMYMVGSDTLQNLEHASSLSSYFYTKTYSLDEIKVAMGKLGLSYYMYAGSNMMYVTFTGLEKNLEASIELISELIYHPKVDQKSLDIILQDEKAGRKFETKDPSTVGDALFEYAVYDQESDYINRNSLKEMKDLTTEQLMEVYRKALSYDASWHFVGKSSGDLVGRMINMHMPLANNQKKVPFKTYNKRETSKTVIFITNDKKAVQSQVNFYVPSIKHKYDIESKASIKAFNQYIDGDFSGIIMQEIREYRSLAYSSYGYLGSSYLDNRKAHFRSYVGCQSDKTNEAIRVMLSILDSMPIKPDRIENIKVGLKNSASEKYPTFRYISRYVENAEKYGPYYLFSPHDFAQYDSLEFEDILAVYNTFVQGRPKIITISGNTSKMDTDALAKLGEIIYVKKKDLFHN